MYIITDSQHADGCRYMIFGTDNGTSHVMQLPAGQSARGNPYLVFGNGIRYFTGKKPTDFTITVAEVSSGSLPAPEPEEREAIAPGDDRYYDGSSAARQEGQR